MKLSVKNWSEFQHYKDRSPAWIKLHRHILDDYDFHSMPVASRALAPMLWLLASETNDGTLDATPRKLAFRLRMTEKEVESAIKPLIDNGFFILEQSASNLLAECLPREEERREEKEEEREKRRYIFDFWKRTMGSPKAVLDDKRSKLIGTMLKAGYSVEDLCKAIEGCSKSPFHMGMNDKGQKYNGIDLIMRGAEKVDQFIGFYNNPPKPVGKQGQIEAINRMAVDDFVNGGLPGFVIEGEVSHG